MCKFYGSLLLALFLALSGSVWAQVPVNIVYPIDGSTVPNTDPSPGTLSSAYITVSFSVTCAGDDTVEWGFDGSPATGQSQFYDQISVQQVYKLPGGAHVFWVQSPRCGSDQVQFQVGS